MFLKMMPMALSRWFRSALPTLVWGWCVVFGLTGAKAVEPVWPWLEFETVATGLNYTTDIQNAGDGSGRLFIVRQDGLISIVQGGATRSTPFLDISARLDFYPGSERGLLGLAFPPGFATKGWFYVTYVRKTDRAKVLSRFRVSADPQIADASSEEVLLVTPNQTGYHYGGRLAFGPDGYLYVSIGDGGQGEPSKNAQDLTSLLGKILRLDVEKTPLGSSYAIPPENPFATHATYRREILCWGLRNPWRFSFDADTGDLYLGDVGEYSREEIDRLPASERNDGANFGWPIKQGSLDYDTTVTGAVGTLRLPFFEYLYTNGPGSAVVGGQLYRGPQARLRGFYFLADYSTGRIWAVQNPADGNRSSMLIDTSYYISTFGCDEAGELYFADYAPGAIYRLRAAEIAPTPFFYPASGTYTQNVTYTIGNPLPEGVIHYTTDGSTPTEASPVFVPGTNKTVTNPTVIKAIVTRPDLQPSLVVQADYQLRPGPVRILSSGPTNDFRTVRLAPAVAAPGAELRYTLNGTVPNATSPLYSDENPILLTKAGFVYASEFRPGWQPSEPASTYFNLAASPPAFQSPWLDLYEPVTLSSATPGAEIHYTIDGSAPTAQSPLWTGPQDLPPGTTIQALAVKGGLTGGATLKVLRISALKASFQQIYTGLSFPSDLARGSDGTFYVIEQNALYKIANGVRSSLAPGTYYYVTMAPGDQVATITASNSLTRILPPAYNTYLVWNLFPLINVGSPFSAADGSFFLSCDNRIYQLTGSNTSTVVAGSGVTDSVNGPALSASFDTPLGVASDPPGNLYVAEFYGRRIRKIGVDRMVSTFAGTGAGGSQSGWLDGPAATAIFEGPRRIVRDRIGNFYVLDQSDRGQIRKIRPDGTVGTLRGPVYKTDGSLLYSDCLRKLTLYGLVVDTDGVLYLIDRGTSSILRVVQEDWDNDGIPDAEETALGAPFVVGADDRELDADGDHIPNVAEWTAGTDPASAQTRRPAAPAAEIAGGQVNLSFPTTAGKTYQLEYTADLLTWKTMGAPFVARFDAWTAQNAASTAIPQRFYRLRELP